MVRKVCGAFDGNRTQIRRRRPLNDRDGMAGAADFWSRTGKSGSTVALRNGERFAHCREMWAARRRSSVRSCGTSRATFAGANSECDYINSLHQRDRLLVRTTTYNGVVSRRRSGSFSAVKHVMFEAAGGQFPCGRGFVTCP